MDDKLGQGRKHAACKIGAIGAMIKMITMMMMMIKTKAMMTMLT